MNYATVDVVKSFAERWEAKDVDGVLEHLTEDCVCNNVPIKEIQGKAAIRAYMEDIFQALDTTRCEWKSIAPSEDGQVLCELDKWMSEGAAEVPLHAMVAFTVRDGKISRWNSYFHMGDLQELGKLSAVLAARS